MSIIKILLLFFFTPMAFASTISGTNLLTDKNINVAPGKKGTVVVFMSAKCPCSNSHISEIKKLAAGFKDFSFVVVHSNADEDVAFSKAYFKTAGLAFPVLQDDSGKLANEFQALKTPHAFLLNPEGKALYKGGVTNSTDAAGADKHFLQDALTDVNEGFPVKNPHGRTLGCLITRKE